MTYYPGHTIRFASVFKVGATPTDPSTVTITLTGPTGATSYVYGTDAEVIKDGTGTYHADLTLPTAGVWRWRWMGTGAAANPDEGLVTVEAGLASASVYCSLDEVKLARRGLPDVLDELIEALIPRASAAIDAHVGRHFGIDAAATDRYFEPSATTQPVSGSTSGVADVDGEVLIP